ncbi:MAG: adenosylcobinamide-GDP ribazoletransferase, partial [Turicibacter sp.]
TREAISESYLGKLFKTGTGLLDQLILCAVFLLMFFLGGFILPATMLIVSILLVSNTQKELGGINGDVAGYILVLSEFAGLCVLALV